MPRSTPAGLLFDYGGTLVDEIGFDARAGNEWLLRHASYLPPNVGIEDVLSRALRITKEVAGRRDETQLETPWPTMTRLIHDYLGVRFDMPMAELEIGFWKSAVRTEPMPGARGALEQLRARGIPLGVVSNTCFGESVIRYELEKHGLAQHFNDIVVSAEYSVRKPSPLLFDTAAARLGVPRDRIWFMGDRLDTDVSGAHAAGMTAIWFNRAGAKDQAKLADFVLSKWEDLLSHCDLFQSDEE